uniref:RNase_PH domain-containing protein n=1 Tax=Macrostomum lignano TaxID=282301 RepID=A0A1I8F8L0_9PLAT
NPDSLMTDILLNGRRVDGRRPNEHRLLRAQLGTQPQADGSALLEHGNSRLLATSCRPVTEEDCVLRVLYNKPPFASMTERRRRGRGDRKQDETALLIEEALGGVVLKQLYRRVLQSDGSELSAAINAVSLALMDAGVAMRGHLAAVTSAGLPASPSPAVGQRVLHASVGARLHSQQLDPLLACASRACACVANQLGQDVKAHLLAACCFQGGVPITALLTSARISHLLGVVEPEFNYASYSRPFEFPIRTLRLDAEDSLRQDLIRSTSPRRPSFIHEARRCQWSDLANLAQAGQLREQLAQGLPELSRWLSETAGKLVSLLKAGQAAKVTNSLFLEVSKDLSG